MSTRLRGFRDCASTKDILFVCAGLAKGNKKPTAADIPTAAELTDWLSRRPTAAQDESADALAALLDRTLPDSKPMFWEDAPADLGWRWARLGDTTLAAAYGGWVGGTFCVAHFQDAKDAASTAQPPFVRAAVWPLHLVHRSYIHAALRYREKVQHPLIALVRAWQNRPTEADPFDLKYRAAFANFRKAGERDRRLLASRQPVLVSGGGQMLLDLPELTPADAGRSWLLDLFDRAGGQSMRQGRGAPWEMRLFVGAMLHLGIAQRDGQWHSLTLPTAEVIRWLHPQGWRNRARDWHRFPEALFHLNERLGYIAIEGLGYVQIITASIIPKTPEDPVVEFTIRIPKSAAHGARIDWPRLRHYGKDSAVLYRAYLTACDVMHVSAHNSQPLTADIAKPLVDAEGQPLRRKGGKIQRSTTERIANPSTRYVRALTTGELTEMVGLIPHNKQQAKTYRQRAVAAFKHLHKDGVINLVEDGKRWLIYGPEKNAS